MTKQPAQYWRQSKEICKWLGRKGQVLATTRIRASSPELSLLTPYTYVLVDFDDQKKELMATGHDELVVGDLVQCVLRKINLQDKQGIIEYGLKVCKVKEEAK